MGPGRETDVFESGRRRRIAAKCALAVLTVALTAAISTIGEAQPAVVVAPGNAAVTGFSGALPPIQIPPGVDPATRTFIDQNGPSLRVIDLQNMGGPPNAQLVGAAKPFTAPAAVIGQVFGVALDDSSPPNIYAAASSAYGLPIVAPGPDGQIQHIKVGAAGASYMAGVWGPHGGPGSIWKIDGRTGAVALFANVRLDGRANSGPALGGLAYDVETKSLFVADRETGFIHRFAFDGRELGRYDHGVAGRAAQGLPPVPWQKGRGINVTSAQFDSTNPATWNYAPPERRVFGLGLNQRRLYYAVADGLQIWSVGIGPDGSLGSDAQIELAVPAANGPTEISKITFDEQGRMFLAERPASTGAFDLEAVATPAIGRVLRYAVSGTTADGRRIWQAMPEEYAIGFPGEWRNGNGGVAIGYNYDHAGKLLPESCGGFIWATGEDLRDAGDASLAARLAKSGPPHVDGLQGNGIWRVKPDNAPPLASYFIEYIDEFADSAARGDLGDIAILRACTPRPVLYPSSPPRPPAGAPPIRHGGGPPSGGTPPGSSTPPGSGPPGGSQPPTGGCSPNLLRDVNTGACLPGCQRPNIQVNGKCCSVATLAANAACSNSNCTSGQTAIGPSNFCCNNGQVYTAAGGAQACCSGQVVNGQCQQPQPPPSTCPAGYVSSGGSCCLASQMTSTGICCPQGQAPAGPNNSQCLVLIHIPPGPSCSCGSGQIPTASGQCCPAANVTSNGECCSGPLNASNRTSCPTPVTSCAPGYSKMRDGSCCNNRNVGRDGSCLTNQPPCPRGEFRDTSGVCAPVAPPEPTCPRGQIADRNGNCVTPSPAPVSPHCPRGGVLDRHGKCITPPPPPPPPRKCGRGEVRDRTGACVPIKTPGCAPGFILTPRGICVPLGVMPGGPGMRRFPGRFGPPMRPFGPGGGFGRPGFR